MSQVDVLHRPQHFVVVLKDFQLYLRVFIPKSRQNQVASLKRLLYVVRKLFLVTELHVIGSYEKLGVVINDCYSQLNEFQNHLVSS